MTSASFSTKLICTEPTQQVLPKLMSQQLGYSVRHHLSLTRLQELFDL